LFLFAHSIAYFGEKINGNWEFLHHRFNGQTLFNHEMHKASESVLAAQTE